MCGSTSRTVFAMETMAGMFSFAVGEVCLKCKPPMFPLYLTEDDAVGMEEAEGACGWAVRQRFQVVSSSALWA